MRQFVIAFIAVAMATAISVATMAQDRETERRMLERLLKSDPENSATIMTLCKSFMLGGAQREIVIAMVELANPGTSSDLYVACPMLKEHGYID